MWSGESVTDNPDAGCESTQRIIGRLCESYVDKKGLPKFQSVDVIGWGASSTRRIELVGGGGFVLCIILRVLANRWSTLADRAPESSASTSCSRFALNSTTTTRCLIK